MQRLCSILGTRADVCGLAQAWPSRSAGLAQAQGTRTKEEEEFLSAPSAVQSLQITHFREDLAGEWGKDSFLKSFLCLSFPCLFRVLKIGLNRSESE